MLLLLALIFGAPDSPAPPESIYVSRAKFDCFVPQGGFPAKQTYYLDLRGCPTVVTAAPKRYGLYPRVGRPTPPPSVYPNVAGTTSTGQPYRNVVAVSGAELNCLADKRRPAAVVRPASDGRYELNFSACR